jgi:hypothetical protein
MKKSNLKNMKSQASSIETASPVANPPLGKQDSIVKFNEPNSNQKELPSQSNKESESEFELEKRSLISVSEMHDTNEMQITSPAESAHSSSPAKIAKHHSEAHNIRIQIGKSEVKHSLSKEYKPDMILLFYDFNHSSNASAKQSMRKETTSTPKLPRQLADFVIKEEAEHEREENPIGANFFQKTNALDRTKPSGHSGQISATEDFDQHLDFAAQVQSEFERVSKEQKSTVRQKQEESSADKRNSSPFLWL